MTDPIRPLTTEVSRALLRFKETLETKSSADAPAYSLFNLATVTYAPPDHAVVKMGSDTYLLDAATGKALVLKSGWEEEVFGPQGRLARGEDLE